MTVPSADSHRTTLVDCVDESTPATSMGSLALARCHRNTFDGNEVHVLLADPHHAIPARAHDRLDPGVRHDLECAPAGTPNLHHTPRTSRRRWVWRHLLARRVIMAAGSAPSRTRRRGPARRRRSIGFLPMRRHYPPDLSSGHVSAACE